jgi:hypothetical protein
LTDISEVLTASIIRAIALMMEGDYMAQDPRRRPNSISTTMQKKKKKKKKLYALE